MKLFRYIFPACLLALTACQKEKPLHDEPDQLPQVMEEQAGTPQLKKTASVLGGLWISDDYLSAIEKTKSIYKNREYKSTILGFVLYKDSLMTGTTALHGFTGHEGGHYRPLKYNASKDQFDYDKKRAREFDEPMQFSLYPTGRNMLEINYKTGKKEHYRKLSEKPEIEEVLDNELNRILFEGAYTDSLSGKKVVFARNGKTEGLGRQHYMLQYDFGEGLYFDNVFIWTDPKMTDQNTYHFKIEGTTIKLYALGGDHDRMEYIISPEPVYILIKQ